MRITSGEHRGRTLYVPKGRDIRPTSDKVRQALFNILLGHEGLPQGAVVLDAFCGTGALGLEALSRGAAFCIFMDKAQNSLDVCRHNVEALRAESKTRLLRNDATRPGLKPATEAAANLVFLDPPYRLGLAPLALESLAQNGWLAPGATGVLESEKQAPDGVPPGFVLLDRRLYGDTKILLCRYTADR